MIAPYRGQYPIVWRHYHEPRGRIRRPYRRIIITIRPVARTRLGGTETQGWAGDTYLVEIVSYLQIGGLAILIISTTTEVPSRQALGAELFASMTPRGLRMAHRSQLGPQQNGAGTTTQSSQEQPPSIQ